MPDAMMRLRFAPSPTGHLHVGNARTALFNWLLARGAGGAFLLRIEDTDAERSTAASEASILEDLRWLGLSWDEGPDIGGPFAPYRQSERTASYRAHAQQLLEQGLAYRCFCSVEQLESERRAALASGQTTRYSGRCRTVSREQAEARLAAGERAAIRFRVPESREVVFEDAVRGVVRFNTDAIGDPVIVRSDGMPAYNFAVVIDDASMGVTHVIRGEDHISNTPRQLLLYEAFGFAPPTFAHLALVMGPDHSPLSKRHGATSVAEFRAKGYLPEALVNYLALVGWSPRGAAAGDPQGGATELMPIDELARRFSLDAVGLSAGVFDEEKLAWVNRHYLKEAGAERLAALSVEFLQAAGVAAHPDQRRPVVSGFGHADRVGVGRSARSGAVATVVPVRFRSGRGAVAQPGPGGDDGGRRPRRRAGVRGRAAGCAAGSTASGSAPLPTRSRPAPDRKGKRSFTRSGLR